MSLIVARNLKRAKAQGAQDAQGDEVIAQKNGYKLVHNTLNDGYWFYTKSGAGWGITATNKVAAINEFNRLVGSAKDAAAKDSIADKEREYTRLYELAQKNITFYAAKGDSAKVAEWKRKADEYKRLAQEATDAAKATDTKDSAAMDAKFKVGDRVKYTGHSTLIYGKTGSVGTIKSVDTTLFGTRYPLYEVEFPETRNGMTDTIAEEHLRLV